MGKEGEGIQKGAGYKPKRGPFRSRLCRVPGKGRRFGVWDVTNAKSLDCRCRSCGWVVLSQEIGVYLLHLRGIYTEMVRAVRGAATAVLAGIKLGKMFVGLFIP